MNLQVAIVGAGPAGLFAAEKLVQAGFGVAIFNRDVKPGGMAEYGIFLDKHNLKAGLRRQFEGILSHESIEYFGNLPVGNDLCVKLNDLQEWGFKAILVASGAQGTKWLGIPGEKLTGVYHAKEVVYHYNKLPPFSTMDIRVGKKTAIVGVGNVMTDVAHYLVRYRDVDEIHVVARRGPAEVKFDKKELEAIIHSFDLAQLDQEFTRVAPIMSAIGQNAAEEKEFILSALEKGAPREGNAKIKMHFLSSPREILGDEKDNAKALVLEENVLALDKENVVARGTGRLVTLEIDTVIFAIGDRVEEGLGLPVERNEYSSTRQPRHPINEQSYEVAGPQSGQPLPGVFVAGWARRASTGLVGNAKKDGVSAAQAIIEYLGSGAKPGGISMEQLNQKIAAKSCAVVRKADLERLIKDEKKRADEMGLTEFKYATNEEMLKVMGLK